MVEQVGEKAKTGADELVFATLSDAYEVVSEAVKLINSEVHNDKLLKGSLGYYGWGIDQLIHLAIDPPSSHNTEEVQKTQLRHAFDSTDIQPLATKPSSGS